MVKRRRTIPEARWSQTEDFVELAISWKSDATKSIWEFVWQGWDCYCLKILSQINLSEADEQIERMITQDLEIDIGDVMSGDEPFVIQHERFEGELRNITPARPKQCDLSFVWRANRRITYPIEAKVLKSDSDNGVKAYVEEISENFLKYRYAPFSSEGGMLGYLLQGSPKVAFKNIETAVSCDLSDHPDFVGRDHKISAHQRVVPEDKTYPDKFRCHHLLLQLSKEPKAKQVSRKRKSSKKLSD